MVFSCKVIDGELGALEAVVLWPNLLPINPEVELVEKMRAGRKGGGGGKGLEIQMHRFTSCTLYLHLSTRGLQGGLLLAGLISTLGTVDN